VPPRWEAGDQPPELWHGLPRELSVKTITSIKILTDKSATYSATEAQVLLINAGYKEVLKTVAFPCFILGRCYYQDYVASNVRATGEL
jgi:hypothetical protein